MKSNEKILNEIKPIKGRNRRRWTTDEVINAMDKARMDTFHRIETQEIGFSRLVKICKGECEHGKCNDWKNLKWKCISFGRVLQ